jgi:hypothetical protein
MAHVKSISFFWKPLREFENLKDAWRVCTKNIDTNLRRDIELNPIKKSRASSTATNAAGN